jgi:hypothetical protein
VDVLVNGDRVALLPGDLLGSGGEGSVFRVNDHALKLFHDPPPQAKVDKLRAFPRRLPTGVVGPLDLAHDPKTGAVVGFTMPLVSGAIDALRLGQRRFRHGVTRNAEVCALLRRLHGILSELHARGVVVGDLNDGNVVFTLPSGHPSAPPGLTPWLIDCDSMQISPHACTVAHERFLDPRLYGVDLSRGVAFDASTDWYAFAVLAFASLLYVHPYGGAHPTIPTLLRRAEAKMSVLRPEVVYPRAATPFAVLSDDLLDAFARTFDRGDRGVFPEAILDARWTTCACGVEHARAACPSCATPTRVPRGTTAGRCSASRLLDTRGRILAVAVQGALLWACEESGVVQREDGAHVPVTVGPGARVALVGGVTWVHEGGILRKIVREHEIERFDAAAFDAGPAGCVYAAGDWLFDAATSTRLGQVLAATTWLRMGNRFGVGFYRAGRVTVGFVLRSGRGMRPFALPNIDGRLVDATAAFDDRRVLLSIATENAGRRTHAVHLVTDDADVVASASGSPESRPLLASPYGKCMAHGAILAPTDDGLLLVKPDPSVGGFVETKAFPETRDFVASGTDLLAGPRGSVYAVQGGEIVHLSLA